MQVIDKAWLAQPVNIQFFCKYFILQENSSDEAN